MDMKENVKSGLEIACACLIIFVAILAVKNLIEVQPLMKTGLTETINEVQNGTLKVF